MGELTSLSEESAAARDRAGAEPLSGCRSALGGFLKAVTFAAKKHEDQRRKGRRQLPYINHPLRVAEILWDIGGVRDVEILIAAVLHDTLEDTETTPDELERAFGDDVLRTVQEVSDDKSLPKAVRKQLQIDHAPHLSRAAKLIKLADKIHNVHEVSHEPPADWPRARVVAYIDWADAVVAGLRGVSAPLEIAYDAVSEKARRKLGSS